MSEPETIIITSVPQIWGAVDDLIEVVARKAGESSYRIRDSPVWYRGHARETYTLWPSLFRSK